MNNTALVEQLVGALNNAEDALNNSQSFLAALNKHGFARVVEQANELALGIIASALTAAKEALHGGGVEPDPQLCKFYDVDTYPKLVASMAHHIEKLQAKLPPSRDTQPGRVREG